MLPSLQIPIVWFLCDDSNKRRDVAVLRVVAKDISAAIVNKLQLDHVSFATRLVTWLVTALNGRSNKQQDENSRCRDNERVEVSLQQQVV